MHIRILLFLCLCMWLRDGMTKWFTYIVCSVCFCLFQAQCWGVSRSSCVSGRCGGPWSALWQGQPPLHQPGAVLQLCRYSEASWLGSLNFSCCVFLVFTSNCRFLCVCFSVDTSSAPPKPSRPGPSRQLQRWPEGGRGGRMKRGGKSLHTWFGVCRL